MMKAAASLLVFFALFLPGCIVGEMRDDLHGVNERLARVEAGLQKLDQTNQALGQTNTAIGGIQDDLAAVRMTLGAVAGAIPDFMLDENAEIAAGAAASKGSAASGSVAAGADSARSSTPQTGAGSGETADARGGRAPVRRDPVIGAWLTQFPQRDSALIFLADGRYIGVSRGTGEVAASQVERGAWKRVDGKSLSLSPESVAGASSAPDRTRSLIVLASSFTAMTVEVDGGVVVYSRP